MTRRLHYLTIGAALLTLASAAAAQEFAGVKEEGGLEFKESGPGEIIVVTPLVVEGRLEKPVALFIKRHEPEFATVRFQRDFWDDILRPVDPEAVKRATDARPYDYVKNPLLWMAVTTAVVSGAATGYQAYNEEWGQVKTYGVTAGVAAAAAAALVVLDRGLASRGR